MGLAEFARPCQPVAPRMAPQTNTARKRSPNLVRKPNNAFPNADQLMRNTKPLPARENLLWLVGWVVRRVYALLNVDSSGAESSEDAETRIAAYDTQALATLVGLASEFEAGLPILKVERQSLRLIDLRLEDARTNLAVAFRAEKKRRSSPKTRSSPSARTDGANTDVEVACRLEAFTSVGIVLAPEQQLKIRNYKLKIRKFKTDESRLPRDVEEAATQVVSSCWRMHNSAVRKALRNLPDNISAALKRRNAYPIDVIDSLARDVLGYESFSYKGRRKGRAERRKKLELTLDKGQPDTAS